MKLSLLFGIGILLCLTVASLFTGVSAVSIVNIFSDREMFDVFVISRLPRTIALILSGSAMGVAGLIMQLITQNRFIEPTLAGTTQSASLGLLIMLIFVPNAPVIVKMSVACLFALVGTGIFMLLLKRVVLKSALIVPIIGIMFGAVISAATVFIAMYFDLLQAIMAWVDGDFSGILQGRYELLWLVGILTIVAYYTADSFTVAGLGREFAINVGLNYRKVMIIGLSVIAVVSGIIVVVVGGLPFLGLIVPNVVSLIMGDNSRKTIPWICLLGSGLVLLCDIAGRIIIYPFELPVSVILGVIGAIVFLFLLLKQASYAKK
ncbi:iron chelate uptake ABC transporter family permease subunit [Orbaceae bacterium ac157xtp]